jgi:hypothetical protein
VLGVVGNVSASTSVTADLSQMNAGPFDLGGGMQLWWYDSTPSLFYHFHSLVYFFIRLLSFTIFLVFPFFII